MKRTRTAFLIAALLGIATTSQAAVVGDAPWTTIGSAGTAISGQLALTNEIAYLDGTHAVVLYNVVAVPGLQATGPQLTYPIMKARFRDNGSQGRIIFRLKRVNVNTGATETLMTLDTNNYAGSASFQTRQVSCGHSFTFDFTDHAYYVEATMTRTGIPSPGIAEIQLGRSNSPCLVPPR